MALWIIRADQQERAPGAEETGGLRRVAELKRLMESAFRTPEFGRIWFRRPLPAFSGRIPMSVLASGEIDGVVGVLAMRASGAHL